MRAPALSALAALLLGTAMVLSPGAVRAEQPEGDVHFGAGSCAAQACHGGATEQRQEYKVWATRDRHSRAYESLSGELGRRIGERLGLDPVRAPECLACHGTVGARTAATFDPHDGVSCELCHGASGRWLAEHAKPGFEKKPAAEKERLGLRDLSTPAKRAAVCVGCHVGGEGREIPHAVMAAGHPPLVFDLFKFAHDMPPHWKKEPAPPAAAWAEGAKAAAAAKLRQLARAAERSADWPEFAAFDCYACHHAIGKDNPHARARPGGRPGDLALDLAPLEVLAAAGDEALAKRLGGVLGATYRPGADRRALADFARRAAEDLERLPIDAAEAEAFARRLDAFLESDGARATYATMQHVAFAVFALSPGRGGAAFAEAYRALDEALSPERSYDPGACAALARRALAAR